MTSTLVPPPVAAPPPVPSESRGPGRARRLLRGRPEDPAWIRPSLVALLALTGLLYLWDLSASGWANSFYATAVQAGSQSWKAFFFGSSDAANFITVDKPPASLWVMALSARLFGFSSWSLLVPQALEGVAAVGLLHLSVRRVAGPVAGLLAGAALALTPVATLMFRFDNPDALLVLLMVGAAYAVLRAVETASTRWLVACGVLVGFAFLTKQLQALLVVPPLGLAYLWAAPTGLWRRVRQLLLAGAALVVSAGWWVAVVELVPASMRPYVGGSETNSILELTLGYNGLGRLTGNQVGSVGGGAGGGRWGETGILRLVSSDTGGQIAWLLPAALLLGAATFWLRRGAPRTDALRAALVVWGGWLVVTALVFSFMQGIFHAYYTVALAPAVAALVGIGAVYAWHHRSSLLARAALVLTPAVTAGWAFALLNRTPDFLPWLRWVVLAVGLAAAVGLAWTPYASRRLGLAAATTAVVVGLAAPAAYSVDTALTPHTGSIVSAGPASAAGPGGFGQGRMGPPPGGFPGGAPGGATTGGGNVTAAPGAGGGMGDLLDASTPSTELVAALQADADSYTWVAAAVGSQNAAGPQLASGYPVMAIGGFNGSDPAPTLAQFQEYVAQGEIHYFIAGGGTGRGGRGGGGPGGGMGAEGTSSEITSWVTSTFSATTIGGVTVYDLTAPVSAGGTA